MPIKKIKINFNVFWARSIIRDTDMPISTDDTDNTDIKKHELLYADLTFKINGVLFSAHNELGQYARERQYGEVVDRLFQEKIYHIRKRWQ